MTLSGSPASLRPPSENTPLLHSSSPRPSMHHGHGFGSSPPSPESQRSQRDRPEMNQLMRYTPLPRSPSPQLELGIETPGPVPNWKHHGVCVQLATWVERVPDLLGVAVSSMPAVLLGCLLNVLDSVSCGSIFSSTAFCVDVTVM
jgi:SulP family sulfate permease